MSPASPSSNNEQYITFQAAASASGLVVAFHDPHPAYAVSQQALDDIAGTGPALVLTVFPAAGALESFASWAERIASPGAVAVKARGAEVWWYPRQAVLQCDPEDMAALRAAVVEFSFYEQELQRLEAEVASSWDALDADRRLACTVTDADLRESNAFTERMGNALRRRIRFARLQPHLLAPDATVSAAAQTLGSSLREKTGLERRAEALDTHLAVFEQIYELASPRMGESRDAHEGQRIEWIIIWLLIAEVALSLLQVVLRR